MSQIALNGPILLVAANPQDSFRLRIDREFKAINKTINASQGRERFTVHQSHASSYEDLRNGILEFSPVLVHFSGHSNEEGLMLEDENGKNKIANPFRIADLFGIEQGLIHCVILNSCFSLQQATLISKYIPYVIGMSFPVGDEAAKKFSTGFYSALCNGRSIRQAHKYGCNSMYETSPNDALVPKLLVNKKNLHGISKIRTKNRSDTSSMEINRFNVIVTIKGDVGSLSQKDKAYFNELIKSHLDYTPLPKDPLRKTGSGTVELELPMKQAEYLESVANSGALHNNGIVNVKIKSLSRRKPFRLLKLMDNRDIERFRAFLESNTFIHEHKRSLIDFFNHCHSVCIWNSDMGKQEFLQKTGLTLSNARFDKRISQLNDQLTVFTGILQFSKNKLDIWPYHLAYCKSQQLEYCELQSRHSRGIRSIKKTLANSDHFRLMFEMEMEMETYDAYRPIPPTGQDLQRLTKHLDDYFILSKLRLLCATANYNLFYEPGGEKKTHQFKLELDWIAEKYSELPTIAKAYFHCYHILLNKEDELHFSKFREYLSPWIRGLPPNNYTELGQLCGYLVNYYFRKMINGNSSVFTNLNYLYDQLLTKQIILIQDQIAPTHFKNIIEIKCQLGHVPDAREFYSEFQNKLTTSHSGAAIAYNELVLLFHEKEYGLVIEKAEQLLNDTNSGIRTWPQYGINLRLIMLMAYFEALFNFSELENWKIWDRIDQKLRLLLRTFPAYLDRKRFPSSAKFRYSNFRKAIQQLYHLTYDLPPSDVRTGKVNDYKDELVQSSNIIYKKWLIGMVNRIQENL